MSGLRIVLSWPEPELWPNRKAYWRVKQAFTRAARDEGYVMAKSALAAAYYVPPADKLPITLTVTGHKPAEHGQDRDNLNAALKASYDGIASALGVNDRRFRHVVDWGEDDPPLGSVIVEIGT